MSKPYVTLVGYNDDWPVRFVREQIAIVDVVGKEFIGIEHIGSTAIPGLDAKPIIDIMCAVNALAEAHKHVKSLESIGYEYRPELGNLLPNRLFFEKGPPDERHFHLHIVEGASEFWERHLLFRDYLRAHQAAVTAYQDLKRSLAEEHSDDRHAYSIAKGEFVEEIIRKARLWHAAGREAE